MDIIFNHFSTLYHICDIEGSQLFPKRIFDRNPYPDCQSQDFRAIEISNEVYNGISFNRSFKDYIEIIMQGNGKGTKISIYLKNEFTLTGKDAFIRFELKGNYGLSQCIEIKIHNIESKISLNSNETFKFRNRHERIGSLNYGYNDVNGDVAAKVYANNKIRYRFTIISPEYITFQDKNSRKFISNFVTDITKDRPYIEAGLFMKYFPTDSSTVIKIKVERFTTRYIDNDIIIESTKLVFKDSSDTKLKISADSISAVLSSKRIEVFHLKLKNCGDNNADYILVKNIYSKNGLLEFDPQTTCILKSNEEVVIRTFLKEGSLNSLLADNIRDTVNIIYSDKNSKDNERTCNVEIVTKTPSSDDADIKVKIKGNKILNIKVPNYDYYPTDTFINGTISIAPENCKNINNISVILKEDNEAFYFESTGTRKVTIDKIEDGNESQINFKIDLKKKILGKYTIIVAADYSEIIEKTFCLHEKELISATPKILSCIREENNTTCYLKGNSKKIAELEIKNDTIEKDSNKAQSLKLSELIVIKDSRNDTEEIKGLVITDEYDNVGENLMVLPPTGKTKVFIKYDSAIADREIRETPISLYYKGAKIDIPQNRPRVAIKNRELEPLPDFLFSGERNCIYKIEDFIIGTLTITKRETKDPDRYISRNDEYYRISDDYKNSFYFLFEDGTTSSEINISNYCEYKCKLIAVSKECVNIEQNLKIPIIYTCKENNDCVEYPCELKLLPIIQKPELNISYQGRGESERHFSEINSKEEEIICPIDKNTTLAKIHVLTIYISNKSYIPYQDISLNISDIKINDKKNNKIEYYNEKNLKILNGNQEIQIPISVATDNIKEGCIINMSYKYENKTYEKRFKIRPQLISKEGWVSLDFGTSGVVMAKLKRENNRNHIEIINLEDAEEKEEFWIESSPQIISSSIILQTKQKEENEDTEKEEIFTFCPSKPEFKHALFQLVPIKFIIGQKFIPFQNTLRNLLKDNNSFYIGEEKIMCDNCDIPKKIVNYAYKCIFNKVDENVIKDMTKFIVTYPNTYVPNQLQYIKNNILQFFKTENTPPIEFVPESDAIVAHYLKNRLNGKGFPIVREKGKERIVIYDMGAGTLDISYVEICHEDESNSYRAIIKNRVGIPLGGNYLDALFYDCLKDKINFTGEELREKSLNARDLIWFLKKCCTEDNKDKSIREIINNYKFNIELLEEEIKLSFITDNDKIKEYINICTIGIMFYLFYQEDNYTDDNNLAKKTKMIAEKVDTIVFSGRGSLFQPIRNSLKAIFSKEKIDETIIEDIKTGVAKGAIEYSQIIHNPKQYQFTIQNQNLYLKIGIIYDCVNANNGKERKYIECINPSDYDWSKIEPENGTRYGSFNKTLPLNLRMVESIRFVQTILPESEIIQILLQNKDKKDFYINELFTIPVEEEFSNPESVIMEIHMDKNLQMTIKLDGDEYLPLTGLEDIENNPCYAKSAWPFNNKIQ